MNRRIVIACVVAALSTSVLLAPAEADEPSSPTDDPTVGPLISGTSSYVGGAFAWTDYAYDDRGADSDGRLGGDTEYPSDLEPNNVADLVQVQIGPDGNTAIEITAVLQTLTTATRPLIGVAFDRDGDPTTGPAGLPGSWNPAAPLGMDALFVLGVDGGRHLEATGDTWHDVDAYPVEVDPDANSVTATVPFDLPDHGTLRAAGVAGYEHAGNSWLDGDAPVHDLAFVDDGWVTTPYLQGVTDAITGFVSGGGYWQDGVQADILAGAADPAPAVAEIDLDTLLAGATVSAKPEAGEFETFLYRSELDLGEGIQGTGNSALYAGPYQPYLVRLPQHPREGLPLVMYLHGASQTHISTVNTAHYDPGTRDPVLGQPDTFFEFDAVVAWPLGRGPQLWYEGPSEQDVLDVTDDVLARLSLDPDRVMLAGLSMGGFGTFRLAQLYPDRWSVAYSDVGADQTDLVENLTALPVRFQNGAADYLVHVNQAIETRNRLDAAETVDYRSWIITKGHHQPAVALAECVYRESFSRPRITNPPRVRYTIDPTMFVDDDASGLRLVYEGAYWVDGMEPAGPGLGSVDLTTSAVGVEAVPASTTSQVQENLVAGRDFCGPDTDVRTNDTWHEQARRVELVERPPEAVVRGTLSGLAAVTVAADRAGVTTGRLELTTDEPTTLTLTGLAPGTSVTAGDTTSKARGDGTAIVSLAPGDNVVHVGDRADGGGGGSSERPGSQRVDT